MSCVYQLLYERFFLAIADVYRLEGNKEYKNKELLKAVYFYTEGLQVNCKDEKLNAKLYHNRATAYFYLGEISSVQFLADISVFNRHQFCRLLIQATFKKPAIVLDSKAPRPWTLNTEYAHNGRKSVNLELKLGQSLRSWC